MEFIEILKKRKNKLLGIILLIIALRFFFKTYKLVIEFQPSYENEVLEYRTSTSYGLSVLGICILCSTLVWAAVYLWKDGTSKKHH